MVPSAPAPNRCEATVRKIFKKIGTARLQAMLLMVFAGFVFSLGMLSNKLIVYDNDNNVIVLLRSLSGCIVLLPFMTKNWSKKSNAINKFNFIEGLFGCISLLTFLLAIERMSMTEVISITFTTPVFVIVLSIIFLKEKMTLKSAIAMLISFSAMLMIMKPSSGNINVGGIYAVITALLWASRAVISKGLNISAKQDKCFIIFYAKLIMSIMIVPFVIYAELPNASQLFYIILSGLLSLAGNFLLLHASTLVPMRIIMPLDFSRLIFTAILGSIALGEQLTLSVFLGALLIFISGLLVSQDDSSEPPKRCDTESLKKALKAQ